MSKKCPMCGRGIGVYQDYVGGTSFFRCDICGHTGCDFEDMTIFDQITQSPETLAKRFVYGFLTKNRVHYWKSTILHGYFKSYGKAYAKTLAKLKEVTKDDR